MTFSGVEGRIYTDDGPNQLMLANASWSAGDKMITIERHDSEADLYNGELHIANSKNGTWNLNAGNEVAYDGSFTPGSKAWLSWANELPILLQEIVIYDERLTDDELLREVWLTSNAFYIRELIQPLISPLTRSLVSD